MQGVPFPGEGLGPGLLEISVHAQTEHDDQNWRSASLREAMSDLVAVARGVDVLETDPMALIESLFSDLSTFDPATDP
jgi:hypothetical protein